MCQITSIMEEMKTQLPEKKEGRFSVSLKGLGFMAFEDKWPFNTLEGAAQRIGCTVEQYGSNCKDGNLEVTLSVAK